jgi:hypothetical protein
LIEHSVLRDLTGPGEGAIVSIDFITKKAIGDFPPVVRDIGVRNVTVRRVNMPCTCAASRAVITNVARRIAISGMSRSQT